MFASSTPPAKPDTAMPDFAVSVAELRKTYAQRRAGSSAKPALDGITLNIPRGMIYGLLGPNGAGKSTLINILAGLVLKDSGQAEVWAYDVAKHSRMARSAIGVVPQELNLDAFFSPREILDLQAGLYGVPKRERRTEELLEIVGLTDKADAYARTLSGGMRRRLMVAKAMVHSPPVLVLDEPTAGVDVELRRALWQSVRALNARGVTVLLTTHYLEEAQELCERIAIINHGKIVAEDSTRGLLSRLNSKLMRIALANNLSHLPQALADIGLSMPAPDRLELRYQPIEAGSVSGGANGANGSMVAKTLAALSALHIEVRDISTQESDLEDVFLSLTR